MDIPRGITYEKGRKRWRVKLVKNGVLLHRSYHREFQAAYDAWLVVKLSTPRPELVPPKPSPINQFLCQPLIRG